MSYEPRTYRTAFDPADLVAFDVVVAETDLRILARDDLAAQAEAIVRRLRFDLESYIAAHPRYLTSFVPLPVERDAPEIVRSMARAAEEFGVGPMAAVAGAVAQRVGEGLSVFSEEVIVENGGDLYLIGSRSRTIALWAGDGHASTIGVRIGGSSLPVAVATLSGRIGHSRSLGDADAFVAISTDGAVADAAATAFANRIRVAADIGPVIEASRGHQGLLGALATIDGAVGAWGALSIVSVGGVR